MKLFQVKPNRLEQFEAKIEEMSASQLQCEGCVSIKYFKRFFTIDGIELGEPPRELTKIIKCIKYYSYWEFDTKENYGKAMDAVDKYTNMVRTSKMVYNDTATNYNKLIRQIPDSFVASLFGFKVREYLKIEDQKTGMPSLKI